MTESQKANSQIIFDTIMKNVKTEEKLLYAGAASRLADSFAQEGFEIVPTAEWKVDGRDTRCSNCGTYVHQDAVTLKPLKTARCHKCGARMRNGTC